MRLKKVVIHQTQTYSKIGSKLREGFREFYNPKRCLSKGFDR